VRQTNVIDEGVKIKKTPKYKSNSRNGRGCAKFKDTKYEPKEESTR